jgi:hypothetical protein
MQNTGRSAVMTAALRSRATISVVRKKYVHEASNQRILPVIAETLAVDICAQAGCASLRPTFRHYSRAEQAERSTERSLFHLYRTGLQEPAPFSGVRLQEACRSMDSCHMGTPHARRAHVCQSMPAGLSAAAVCS